jgi:MoaA/NifB/PqqE/SkfB family radical SAM enzyme
MELAKSLGVHFVRPIDPRRTGQFAMSEQEVELEKQHWSVLEDFHRKIQHNPAYRDYPVVEYHGAFNRAIGCGGAGDRHLYIDTDGDFHACPFCRHKCGSALDGNFEAGLAQLRAGAGCHKFHAVGAVAGEVTAWTNH